MPEKLSVITHAQPGTDMSLTIMYFLFTIDLSEPGLGVSLHSGLPSPDSDSQGSDALHAFRPHMPRETSSRFERQTVRKE